jgi:hypothetical protein
MPRVDRQSSALNHRVHDREHVREVKVWREPLRVAIEGEGDQVDIAGSLSVAKNGTLDSVRTSEDTKFRRSDRRSSVVVRMQGDDALLPLRDRGAELLDLRPM